MVQKSVVYKWKKDILYILLASLLPVGFARHTFWFVFFYYYDPAEVVTRYGLKCEVKKLLKLSTFSTEKGEKRYSVWVYFVFIHGIASRFC